MSIPYAPKPTSLGHVEIDGKRYEVRPDPVWYRYWTRQVDGRVAIVPGSIPTVAIEGGAATEVEQVYRNILTVIGASNLPPEEASRTLVIGSSYTPDHDCTVMVSVSCLFEYTATLGPVTIDGGIFDGPTYDTDGDTVQRRYAGPGAVSEVGDISTRRSFDCLAGHTYEFGFWVSKYRPADTLIMRNIYMQREAIKV